MGIFQGFFGTKRSNSALVIESPQFGVLNLKGSLAEILISEDSGAISPVLGQAQLSTGSPPKCNVLFIYSDIESDGRIRGSKSSLREIIRDSGALVVVVASENDGNAYIAAGKNTGYGKANLVMTLQRNGAVFPNFFAHLFEEMKKGVTMPMAWVKLVPQGPNQKHDDCPGTIFACEVGQVTFR